MNSIAIVAIAFLAFAFLHSLTVSRVFKRAVASVIGERLMRAYYRLAFTVLSFITLALALYVLLKQPDVIYYEPPWYIAMPGWVLQLAGLVLLITALGPFDLGYFLGISQAFKFIRTGKTGGDIEGIEGSALITTGLYGLVRHPMYLGGMVMFLFGPEMTRNTLVVRVLGIVYFVYGALIEERRFLADFGQAYLEYQKKVPMFNILAGILRKARK